MSLLATKKESDAEKLREVIRLLKLALDRCNGTLREADASARLNRLSDEQVSSKSHE